MFGFRPRDMVEVARDVPRSWLALYAPSKPVREGEMVVGTLPEYLQKMWALACHCSTSQARPRLRALEISEVLKRAALVVFREEDRRLWEEPWLGLRVDWQVVAPANRDARMAGVRIMCSGPD